ncbi:phosphoethanolamine transferase [Marinobacterium lutimaris]|uniref:Phosphatidylethanolamine:Kdo2-lipid A phosphoethanolamine transferase n=1 Tax=Marinobacterium lutimaris TaxID=568106 RepID=A0A1H5ZBH5_9GAMM|nr:phosphoethanolamine--lipid A transferase [Marinobacterium lutimaris]SEG33095.1 phosphatidylethanolamine:Kdo2-lipid A phosphoethanolamine transferase [Marinobacterium lutimaris]
MTRFRLSALPALSPLTYSALLTLTLALLYNGPLWQLILDQSYPSDLKRWGFTLAFFSFIYAVLQLFMGTLSWRQIIKPLAIFLILSSSSISYLMQSYGIVIDKGMVQNLFQTDVAEAGELLSSGLILHFLLTGLAPALVFTLIPIKKVTPVRMLALQSANLFACLALIGLNAGLLYKDYSSLFRNHREVRNLAVPSNFLYYGGRYLAGAYDPEDRTFEVLGSDARHISSPLLQVGTTPKSDLMVVVVGETARADHFSLNGYSRDTNPELEQRNVISFTQVESCGTATAVSLPCMFSFLGRDRFDDSKALFQSNVLDVMSSAKIDALWRDNNSGCKGVCERIPSEEPKQFVTAADCKGDECFDQAMLNNLDQFLASGNGPKILLLHQKGSHGPAYYKRVPDSFQRYTPVCESSELQTCSADDIVNAYDNTILYTDHFLASVIDYLKTKQANYNTAMLYMSDHGESLGENNVYLHGMPWLLAPDAQKHVPMVFWSSEGFRSSRGIDQTCLQNLKDKAVSQDNLPHSLLGLMQVSTSVYQPELDLFASCRQSESQLALQPVSADQAG